jgi:uncharacterized protein
MSHDPGSLWKAAIVDRDLDAVRAALDAGAGVDVIDAEGRSLLATAALRADDELVDMLLDAGAAPAGLARWRVTPGGNTGRWTAARTESATPLGMSPLATACWVPLGTVGISPPQRFAPDPRRGRIVQALIARGARFDDAAGDEAARAVLGASCLGDDVLDAILGAGAGIEAVLADGTTPLTTAARTGYAAAVERLLARGADPSRPDRRGASPLGAVLASTTPGDAVEPEREKRRKVTALLAAGADPDRGGVPDARATRPLVFALAACPELAPALVAAGASRKGLRAPQRLVLAAALGEADEADALLASLPARDAASRHRAFVAACACGQDATVAGLITAGRVVDGICAAAANGHLRVVEQLLPHLETPRQRQLALEAAGIAGHAALVTFLIAHGAPLDYPSYPTAAPLCRFVERGRIDCIRAVLDAGASVAAVVAGHPPSTPLVTAVRFGERSVVEALLDAGVARFVDGALAAILQDQARRHGHDALAAVLDARLAT